MISIKNPPLWVFKAVVGSNRNDAEVLKEIWHGVSFALTTEKRDWYAMSHNALSKKTMLSTDMIERSLARLRRATLVTSSQHIFGGKNVNHYRLTEKAVSAIEAAASSNQLAPPESCKSAGPESCKSAGPESCKSAGLLKAPYTTSESTPSSTATASPTAQLCPDGEIASKTEAGEGGALNKDAPEIGFEEMSMKMADNFKNEGWKAKSMKVLHKPNSPSSLETIWKHKVSETDPLLIKIGKKERGQFTHFRNACPPDAADEVLTWVLDNWAHYAYKVAGYKALQKVPTAPDLGFLLLYDNIAVSCWNLSKAPKKQEAKPAISVDKPVQATSLASKHKTVSMDDLLADPED